MTTQIDVPKLIRKTRQYEFLDGLRDLQIAVVFILLGCLSWFMFKPEWWAFILNIKHTFGRWAMWAVLLLAIFIPAAATWGTLRIMKYLRQRWLWRESGMVEASLILVPRHVTILSSVIAIGGIILGFRLRSYGWVDNSFVLRMIWTAIGWSTGYTMIGLGRSLDIGRYILLGIIGGLSSTVILFLPITFGHAGLLVLLGWGFMLAISGAITLRRVWPSKVEAN